MQLTVCVHQRSVAASSVTAPTWCPLRRPRTQQQVGHMHCTVGDRRNGGGCIGCSWLRAAGPTVAVLFTWSPTYVTAGWDGGETEEGCGVFGCEIRSLWLSAAGPTCAVCSTCCL